MQYIVKKKKEKREEAKKMEKRAKYTFVKFKQVYRRVVQEYHPSSDEYPLKTSLITREQKPKK